MCLFTCAGELYHPFDCLVSDKKLPYGLYRKLDPSAFIFLDVLRVREKATYILDFEADRGAAVGERGRSGPE